LKKNVRFSGTVFDAVNKVRSCLRQPIFNGCMASRGQKGRDIEGAGREAVQNARGTKIEVRDSGLRMKWN